MPLFLLAPFFFSPLCPFSASSIRHISFSSLRTLFSSSLLDLSSLRLKTHPLPLPRGDSGSSSSLRPSVPSSQNPPLAPPKRGFRKLFVPPPLCPVTTSNCRTIESSNKPTIQPYNYIQQFSLFFERIFEKIIIK